MALLDQLTELKAKVVETFKKFSPRQRWIIAGVGAGVFALVFSLVAFAGGEGGMAAIQSPIKDVQAAQAELGKYGIESQFSTDKSDLMVPRDKRDRALIILNAARLLPDGLNNYEFLGQADFTSTEPQRYERIRVQIEDLLRHTIQAMEGVRQASVRITPASREVLFKPEAGKNKASVTVELSGQDRLVQPQVVSIANLVASSYPGLAAEDVFIMDTTGRPYAFHDDAQMSADRYQLRQQVERNVEEKANSVLAPFGATVAATVDVRLLDEVKESHTDYQPDGAEPIVGYRETSKEKRTTRSEKGTAGLRAESQNSNRTDAAGGALAGNEERAESLERNVLDEAVKSQLERMKLVINYDQSSLAISIPEELAADDAAQGAMRSKVQNLAAGATGLSAAKIAVEFVPRLPAAQGEGLMSTFFGTGGMLERYSHLLGYGVLLVLILGAFWILNSMVKKSAPKPIPSLSEPTLAEAEAAAELALPTLPGAPNKLEANLIYEKVNQIIEENPRAAANLLKRWLIFNE
ncbi:MAG: hypothetical protein IT463_00875 [Planctomycetes bacterium]|nr:hypothetical protein [Planctomycetota bacterium]